MHWFSSIYGSIKDGGFRDSFDQGSINVTPHTFNVGDHTPRYSLSKNPPPKYYTIVRLKPVEAGN